MHVKGVRIYKAHSCERRRAVQFSQELALISLNAQDRTQSSRRGSAIATDLRTHAGWAKTVPLARSRT